MHLNVLKLTPLKLKGKIRVQEYSIKLSDFFQNNLTMYVKCQFIAIVYRFNKFAVVKKKFANI